MEQSSSQFIKVRGLDYHCRVWGRERAPRIFCLHGWMDVSASFQFMVDALFETSTRDWQVIAPDWRGFGLTGWNNAESYWFPDYLADLERILDHFQPEAPVNLVGHSMGGNIASLYSGVRPARVARLVNLEGFGMQAMAPALAPGRYARWLDELKQGERLRDYDSFNALAARLRDSNPRLSAERALFLARHWGRELNGRVVLRADPRHKLLNPILYRLEEARACWQQVTAPVLWVTGAQSKIMRFDEAEHAARKACFKNLTAHVIADAGHMLHHDQPEELARVIETFIPASRSG
jgi:pimeloyl-ACP methyl ester carboxylesterase